jgi:hypothetical protein
VHEEKDGGNSMRIVEHKIINDELALIKGYIETGDTKSAIAHIDDAIERHDGWMKLSPNAKACDTLQAESKRHYEIMDSCLKCGDINGAALRDNICRGLDYARGLIINAGDEFDEAQTSEWISVKDRLPENASPVLCITYKGNPFVARYDHKWARWRVSGTTDVTHWMPLPKPPKGASE